MKPLIISELADILAFELGKGHGDYVVFVSDDEECNGFHALWTGGHTPSQMSKECRADYEEINRDLDILKNKDKAYYLE